MRDRDYIVGIFSWWLTFAKDGLGLCQGFWWRERGRREVDEGGDVGKL